MVAESSAKKLSVLKLEAEQYLFDEVLILLWYHFWIVHAAINCFGKFPFYGSKTIILCLFDRIDVPVVVMNVG